MNIYIYIYIYIILFNLNKIIFQKMSVIFNEICVNIFDNFIFNYIFVQNISYYLIIKAILCCFCGRSRNLIKCVGKDRHIFIIEYY